MKKSITFFILLITLSSCSGKKFNYEKIIASDKELLAEQNQFTEYSSLPFASSIYKYSDVENRYIFEVSHSKQIFEDVHLLIMLNTSTYYFFGYDNSYKLVDETYEIKDKKTEYKGLRIAFKFENNIELLKVKFTSKNIESIYYQLTF